ncbi:MAG: outer membrane beta-barrel protein [Bacteroidales bacterium]
MILHKHNLFILLLIFFSISTIRSQSYSVIGRIVESANKQPLQQVTIRIYKNQKDSLFVGGTTSDKNGFFSFKNTQIGKFFIRIEYMGYKKQFKNFEFKSESKGIDVGTITLIQSNINLSEAVVVGRLPEVVVKQDTLEYNPEAYKLQPGSVVEDMLKRMSGVEIDTEGKIKVAGKEVKKVFVDGKEFFGNDPTVATKNFTTDMIERIQVIDKKSDLTLLTGIDDGEEETVINLTIKKGMKKGWMANLQGGLGKEVIANSVNGTRYESNALINRFFGESQFSVIANGNNTNNQGSRDWGSGFNSQMGLKGGRSLGGNNSGITTSNVVGVNGAFAINDKLKIGGNIMFNSSDNFVSQTTNRKNLLKDSVSFNKTRSENQYNSDNFSTAFKIEYKPDSAWTFIFTPTISVNKSNSYNNDTTALLAGIKQDSINSTNKHSFNKNIGLSLNSRFDISYQFKTKGRRLSFSIEGGHNEGDGFGTIYANTIYQQRGYSRLQDQQIVNKSSNNSFRFYTTYVEPIGTNNFLQFSYSLKTNYSYSDKFSYNHNQDHNLKEYTILDSVYSKSLENSYINQQIGTSLRAVREKYSYTVGIELTPSVTHSKTFLLDSIFSYRPSHSVINYAPNLEYNYRFDRSHNLRINYRGQSKQPSISQLDPSKSQSSSTSITKGNPDLLPTFNNNLTIRYTGNNKETQRSLMATIQCQYIVNSIINKTSYDADGNRLTEYVNENGEWNSSLALMYNTPIGGSKFQINNYYTGSYNNQIGYSAYRTNGSASLPLKNKSNTLSLNDNFGIIYRNAWLYSQLRGSVKYAKSRNSLASLQDNETMTNSISYNAQFTLPYGLSLSSDIKYSENRGFSAGFDKNETIWNAELSKTIFAKNQGTLRLKIFDILRQQLNYSWVSNAQYVQDSQFNTLSSYFMLFFNYRFNSVGAGQRNSRRGEFHRRDSENEGGEFRRGDSF